MQRTVLALILALATAVSAAAQSTAINGTIEGTVTDDQKAVLPGVTVTVVNIDTGDTRAVVTNESGLYRAPLLSLGTYKVTAELQGFKKFEQTGVTLRAGQTAVISFALAVGTLEETVTVTADAPIVDLGKIEQGRTLSQAEIKTLPLTSRNPYNFALLQPGVVGFETNEFGVPRLTANGALRAALEQLGRKRRVEVLVPPRELCTDNAAMGAIAWERLERGGDDGLDLDVSPGTDRRPRG